MVHAGSSGDGARARLGRGGQQIAPFYIDLEQPVPASGIPKPGPLEVHLKDDHLQYAITWFALAGAVVIAFGVWLRGAAADVNASAANRLLVMVRFVSYLSEKRNNHETYGNGTGLCVRALQHLRICPHSSSRRTSRPIHVWRCCAVTTRIQIWQSNGNFSGSGNRDVGPLGRLLWAA